jgi:hypothetical protein
MATRGGPSVLRLVNRVWSLLVRLGEDLFGGLGPR